MADVTDEKALRIALRELCYKHTHDARLEGGYYAESGINPREIRALLGVVDPARQSPRWPCGLRVEHEAHVATWEQRTHEGSAWASTERGEYHCRGVRFGPGYAPTNLPRQEARRG